MQTRITIGVFIFILALSIALALYAYPLVPDRIATHWNAVGEVNGSLDKTWGLALMPIIIFIAGIGFILIPRIDPLRQNIAIFRNRYNALACIILLSILYLEALMVAWNLGHMFNVSRFIAPAIAVLFIFLGFIMRKIKRNYFIGIRTPWTLASDRVWEKTHYRGAYVFTLVGLIALLGAFFPAPIWYIFLLAIFVGCAWLVLFSYLEFRRETSGASRSGK